MEKRELQEVLLEKLSSIEKSLHLIAFSMYLQTKPNDVQSWEDEADIEIYLNEAKKNFDLDKLHQDKLKEITVRALFGR